MSWIKSPKFNWITRVRSAMAHLHGYKNIMCFLLLMAYIFHADFWKTNSFTLRWIFSSSPIFFLQLSTNWNQPFSANFQMHPNLQNYFLLSKPTFISGKLEKKLTEHVPVRYSRDECSSQPCYLTTQFLVVLSVDVRKTEKIQVPTIQNPFF